MEGGNMQLESRELEGTRIKERYGIEIWLL